MREVAQHFGRFWWSVRKRCQSVVEAFRCCRECGRRVAFFEDICPGCGAAEPITLPVSPPLVISTVGALAVFILLALT
ncbi:MAG: hypothetical protein JXB62_15365 [Pirellulales bacterium]|nr:hypothetical protein [Pirellulales bacterium]